MARPLVLVLGANFGGLTASRLIRRECGDAVDITVIDRKSYLLFVPNIPLEVFDGHDPADKLHMPTQKIFANDGDVFVQAEVREIDVDAKRVSYTPTERPGAATESISYDYLVIALGARLDYQAIDGFAEFGHTFSDSYYGNKFRRYLYGDEYRGGPIAIGSARFIQGSRGRPDWLPEMVAACEGPPLEVGLSLAAWLKKRRKGDAKNITLFTPGEWIAEDAGLTIVKEFLAMASGMGFGYKNNTQDVKRLTADGIEFTNGESLEAEVKIVLPNWNPHAFMKDLPIVDEVGFVITDRLMRNQDHPEVFAVGDCAALAAPKLGGIGDSQARVVANQIAKAVGRKSAQEADEPFAPMILCFGDMGDNKAFYIHSNEFFGGDEHVLRMGRAYYQMKLGFKEMYYRTGGMPPKWGIPMAEMFGDHL